MQHKTLQTKAATLTDQGEFTAIAAAYTVDRVNDRIIPGAFKKTIEKWQTSGKQIPLHWDHEGSADSIIGSVDPMSMKEVELGLFVAGKVDIEDSEVAKDAWRSVKKNRVSLSFGYMATKKRKRADGVTDLLGIDLFEVSIVPAPANPDTKFLSFKNVEAALEAETEQVEAGEQPEISAVEDGRDEEPETVKSAPQDPLFREARELIARNAYGGPLPKSLPEPEPDPEPEPLDYEGLEREAWGLLLKKRG